MMKRAWYIVLGAAALVGAVGCGDDSPPDCPTGSICVDSGTDDAGVGDAGTADTGTADAEPPGTCGDPGRTGGPCRRGACLDRLTCLEELTVMGAPLTARNGFGWGQAMADDDANPTRWTTITPPSPANDVPIPFVPGSMCTQQCNDAAATDSCGSCAKCSQQLGEDGLGLPAWIFIATADRMFGTDTGFCRAHCNFAIDTNGGCPTGYTCDAFTNLCLEGCVNTNQCNAALIVTEELEYATWVIPTAGQTCDMTTRRCDWDGPADAHVGDACERQADCTSDIGVCLRGGTCAETQCNNTAIAPDTEMGGICDGGRGICLGTGGNMGAVCVEGCTTSMDCNPGNACIPLLDSSGGPVTVGSFSGYCLGICDTVFSGGTDVTFNCRTGEQCDMPEPTADDMDPNGVCRETCDPAGTPTGCDADEICEQAGTEAYGFCRPQGNICYDSTGCYGTQICNNVLGAPTFGRCVDPCDVAAVPPDCTAPAVCVDSGTLMGLCAEPCTSPTTCGMGRTCQIPAGMTAGYCVEAP